MKVNELLKEDEKRNTDYQEIKKLLDKLHDDFIIHSLSNVSFQWSDFLGEYKTYRAKMRNRKDLSEKERKELDE